MSIITPVYNSEKFIEETIHSVQQQTYLNWEMLILCDAGTTDQTPSIVQRKAESDARLLWVDVPGGRGVSDARNYGFQMAKGRFIALLDADDLWLEEKLEKQVKFMQERGAALSFTAYRRLSVDGARVGRLIHAPHEVSYASLLKHNPIACVTIMIDQDRTGPLKMRDDIHEDYSLWLKLVRMGHKACGLNEDLGRYRIVPGSRSSRRWLMAMWRWQVYREHQELSVLKSLYYMGWYIGLTLLKHLRF